MIRCGVPLRREARIAFHARLEPRVGADACSIVFLSLKGYNFLSVKNPYF